jgi:hypothetical protein
VPNRLATSTSPYLLQHQDNPVDWREWGDDAFAEARDRDVPILLSVGYAACHWCHVRLAGGSPIPLREAAGWVPRKYRASPDTSSGTTDRAVRHVCHWHRAFP